MHYFILNTLLFVLSNFVATHIAHISLSLSFSACQCGSFSWPNPCRNNIESRSLRYGGVVRRSSGGNDRSRWGRSDYFQPVGPSDCRPSCWKKMRCLLLRRPSDCSNSIGIIVTPLALDEFNGPRGDFYKHMFAAYPAGRPGTATRSPMPPNC